MIDKDTLNLDKLITKEVIKIFEDIVSGPIKIGENSYKYDININNNKMIKKFKHKPTVWWGFELIQKECNCSFENKELKTKQIYNTEKKRDKALNKLISNNDYCIIKYDKFCTIINEIKKPL
jgi:hypothetical protein